VTKPLTKQADMPTGSRRTGRPTQNDAKRRSEMLIGVATDFFVEHGFSGSTIEAIAQAANMGKQAVYTRFTDKESLFNAVIQRLKEKAVFLEMPSDDASPIAEGLPRRIRAIILDATTPQSVTVSKLAMREGHRFPELVPLLVEGTTERYARPLAAYLDARKRAGEVRDIDTLQVAAMILDLLLAEVGRSVFIDNPVALLDVDRCAERVSALILIGISTS
jgi:TetR/AcrR family transcriptional regulator, mexJK operon transcriptional repressor